MCRKDHYKVHDSPPESSLEIETPVEQATVPGQHLSPLVIAGTSIRPFDESVSEVRVTDGFLKFRTSSNNECRINTVMKAYEIDHAYGFLSYAPYGQARARTYLGKPLIKSHVVGSIRTF